MPRTCLVIDDSLTIRRGLKLALERAALFDTLLEAPGGAEALDLLAPGGDREAGPRVDLVLCDLVMPGIDGFGFLDAFRAHRQDTDVPVIVLTGQETVEKKVEALDAGAADYLTKPFDPAELVARVRVHLKVKYLRDELKAANARLQALSTTDALTGASTRAHFLEQLETELGRGRRHNTQAAVLLLDVDHLKAVNETHGQAVGDRALTEVYEVLRASLRRHDAVARYGDATFAALLPQTGRAEAAAAAEKLRAAVSQHDFAEAESVPLTMSVGVATFPDAGIDDGDTLLRRAEDALLRAKEMGRDRVVMWLGELDQAAAVALQV